MLFEAVGWILNLSVHWLNEFVFLIDRMPMALINGLTIATVELVAWYIIIVLIILLLRQMRALYFISFLSCVLVVSCFYTYRNITQLHNTEMTVYSTKKLHGLAFIRGKEVCYDFDDALRSNWSTMMFHVQHHWWARGVEHEHNLRESSSDIVPSVQTSVGRLYAFAGKKILLCEQAPPYRKQPLREKLEADVLVLSHNPKMSLKNLLKLVTVKQVVTDGSNKKYKVAKWREECRLAKVPFHDVSEQGAFRVEL